MALSDDQFVFLTIQMWVMGVTLDIFLTGVYTCIIFFILYLFFSRRRKCRTRKSSIILPGVILLMFVIRMIHVGVVWYEFWFTMVENGDSRDSVIAAINAAPGFVLSDVTGILLIAISDSIMVWRCWVVTNSNIKLTVIPFLINIVAIVCGFVFIGLDRAGDTTPPMALLMTLLNTVLSLATTVLCTLIITIRILMVGKVPGEMRVQRHYSKPLAIIIESSALYTVSFIIYLPFFAISNDFTNTTFLCVDGIAQNMTVIAPALIMLRVLMGRDQPDGERSGAQSPSKMTTLHFDHDEGSRSEQSNVSSGNGEEDVDVSQPDRSAKEPV